MQLVHDQIEPSLCYMIDLTKPLYQVFLCLTLTLWSYKCRTLHWVYLNFTLVVFDQHSNLVRSFLYCFVIVPIIYHSQFWFTGIFDNLVLCFIQVINEG